MSASAADSGSIAHRGNPSVWANSCHNLRLRPLTILSLRDKLAQTVQEQLCRCAQVREPTREVWTHDEAFVASRLSVTRIGARRARGGAQLFPVSLTGGCLR